MLYDVVIVGAGPAGMSAGIYSLRNGLKTMIISKDIGGQILRKSVFIENYPGFKKISGPSLIKRFKEHLFSYNVDFLSDEVVQIKKNQYFEVATQKGKKIFSKTVIIACGLQPRRLGLADEEKFLGKGLSYCALCDGPLFKEKTVAVIGGGNSGLESAIFLARWAKKIYIIEINESLSGDQINQDIVKKNKKINIITCAILKKIIGERFVKAIQYFDKKISKNIILDVDGVFVEIGNVAVTEFVKNLVDLNEKKEIMVDFETYQTKTPGLFAAGDCNFGKHKQIITACSEGAKSALSAFDFIKKNY